MRLLGVVIMTVATVVVASFVRDHWGEDIAMVAFMAWLMAWASSLFAGPGGRR